MVIDNIVLSNYGPYRGENSIDFTPEPDKPLILFGGLNGAGKTSLLDSFQLVLYGRMANCSTRGDLSYVEFLKSCIHWGSTGGSSVEINFRAHSGGHENSYCINRSWDSSGSETLRVSVNGELDVVRSEHWLDYVDEFIPQRISGLFIFDGEKVKDLADVGTSSKILENAVSSLLGLDLIERLDKDLIVFEKKNRIDISDDSEREDIEGLEKEIEDLESQKAELVSTLSDKAIQSESLSERLDVVNKEFSELGGEFYDKISEVESSLIEKKQESSGLKGEMLRMAASGLPLSIVNDLVLEVIAQGKAEYKASKASSILEVLNKRDKGALDLIDSGSDEYKKIKGYLDDSRKVYEEAVACDAYLNISNVATQRQLQFIVDGEMKTLMAEGSGLTDKVLRLEGEIVDLERAAASTPDKASVLEIVQERERVSLELEGVSNSIEKMRQNLEEVDSRIERTNATYVAKIESGMKDGFHLNDKERFISHAIGVRDVLDDFKKEVLSRHLSEIEVEIFNSFDSLVRKEGVLDSVKIGEDYSISLLDDKKKVIASDRMSAGEKQLLAISILWALAKVSERSLPTIIDTPLGRLDGQHRKNLIERYFPCVGHQVIMFSTDEEISSEYFKDVEGYTCKTYRLEYVEDEKFTKIEKGYFEYGD